MLNRKRMINKLRKQDSCLIHCKVTNHLECRERWWKGGCENQIKKYHSRANCQKVNMPNVFIPKFKRIKEDTSTPKPKKEAKMPKTTPHIDAASDILSEAKGPKEVLKIMRSHPLIKGDKKRNETLKNLADQLANGTANAGRIKMTCLNMLRAVLRKDSSKAEVAKPKAKAEKKATVRKSRPAPKAKAKAEPEVQPEEKKAVRVKRG